MIGNITESYPVVPLFPAIFAVAVFITVFIYKKTKTELLTLPNLKQKLILLGSFFVLTGIRLLGLHFTTKITACNVFEEEIQANGLPKFYWAFTHNELDYFQFYPKIDQKLAEKNFLNQFSEPVLKRNITSEQPELKKNVVLISIESLSSDFMEHYGNT